MNVLYCGVPASNNRFSYRRSPWLLSEPHAVELLAQKVTWRDLRSRLPSDPLSRFPYLSSASSFFPVSLKEQTDHEQRTRAGRLVHVLSPGEQRVVPG